MFLPLVNIHIFAKISNIFAKPVGLGLCTLPNGKQASANILMLATSIANTIKTTDRGANPASGMFPSIDSIRKHFRQHERPSTTKFVHRKHAICLRKHVIVIIVDKNCSRNPSQTQLRIANTSCRSQTLPDRGAMVNRLRGHPKTEMRS